MPTRSNEEWLAALRRPEEEALADLRAFLRSGAALATAPVVGVDAGGVR